MKHKSLLV